MREKEMRERYILDEHIRVVDKEGRRVLGPPQREGVLDLLARSRGLTRVEVCLILWVGRM